MKKYKIITPASTYELESDSILQDILLRENISYSEIAEESSSFMLLSQKDKRWANVTLGNSSSNLYNFGCTMTSLAMHSGWMGRFVRPDFMAKNFSFTNDGKILWQSINKADVPFNFVWRYYQKDDKKMKEILYSDNRAAIVEVYLGKSRHWVALIGYDAVNGFKIADPWYNDYVYLKKRYGTYIGFAEIEKR